MAIRRVQLVVNATATIEETWTFEVSDDWTLDRLRRDGNAEALLASGNAVSVTDRIIGGERDRKVIAVEEG